MTRKEKIKHVLKNPLWIIVMLNNRGLHLLGDEAYIRLLFRLNLNKRANLDNPQTFNEKIQWLKLHDRKAKYTTMVDKYEAKKYVANIIGKEHIIPTIGVYERFDDIDFANLPDQFVIKCTHDSGGLVVCKDKKKFNQKMARKKINKCMDKNFYWSSREWPYKNVKPRIIVEQYMSSFGDNPDDYKVHCFNGKPKIILVCKDRFNQNGMSEDFFDTKWRHLDLKRPNQKTSQELISKPVKLEEILSYSKELSKDIPFLRIDFYIIDGKVYFGELTFFPASGLRPFVPEEWDKKMGKMIKLEDKT